MVLEWAQVRRNPEDGMMGGGEVGIDQEHISSMSWILACNCTLWQHRLYQLAVSFGKLEGERS